MSPPTERRPAPRRGFQRERGIGVVEVLVAVLLLSFGFLAAARMQVQSLRFSQTASHRSQAFFMATDMIDRMRSNTAGAVGGAYDGLETSASTADPGCGERACDGTEIARQDLHDWSGRLHADEANAEFVPALPSATGIPAVGTVDRVADGVYRVTVRWAEPEGDGYTGASLSMSFATEVPG